MQASEGLGYVQGVSVAVSDPMLMAGRGREFSAAYLAEQEDARIQMSIANDEDFRLPIDHEPQQGLRTAGIEIASMDTPIPETNMGYRLLQKMGWSQGKGLGKDESGRVDPVRGSETAGLRFGVGKAEQDSFFTSEENVTRKKLESEAQLEETEEETRIREMKAVQQEKIKEVIKEELSTFYCELCNKQYKTAMELETHLSSYDHHHKKRLLEMKQMTAERTKGDRARREKKRLEKEMASLNDQVRRAQQMAGPQSAAPPLPPDAPPPDMPPPPPPQAPELSPAGATEPSGLVSEQRQGMAFSFGRSMPSGGRRGGFAGRGLLGRGNAGRGPAKPKAAGGLAMFAQDSDSDD